MQGNETGRRIRIAPEVGKPICYGADGNELLFFIETKPKNKYIRLYDVHAFLVDVR